MFIRVKWLFHSVIVLQIMKSPPPQFDETIPGRVSSFWTHQQGLSRHDQKPKSHICNNMKNLVSIYYKFLRTQHTHSACYHFGTGIPSVSKMQYTTQRVYSKRDLFEIMSLLRDEPGGVTTCRVHLNVIMRGCRLLVYKARRLPL